MPDNISPIGDAVPRTTYAELGHVWGISPLSAERLVRRKGWPGQRGNDGFVRVLVPLAEARKTSKKLPLRTGQRHVLPDCHP